MPTPADQILAKTPLPTHLDSAEIREQWTAVSDPSETAILG